MTTGIGIAFNALDDPRDLIDVLTVGTRPGSPLISVDWSKLAVFVGPLVPDADAVFFQISDVGLTSQKPEQLVNDRRKMQSFGGDSGESGAQIETHLVTERADCANARTIIFVRAVITNVPYEIEVLFHRCFSLPPFRRDRAGMVGGVVSGTAKRYAYHTNSAPTIIIGALSTWPMVTQLNAM